MGAKGCIRDDGPRNLRVALAASTVESGLVHNMIPSERIGQRGDCSSIEDTYVVQGFSDVNFVCCHVILAQESRAFSSRVRAMVIRTQ